MESQKDFFQFFDFKNRVKKLKLKIVTLFTLSILLCVIEFHLDNLFKEVDCHIYVDAPDPRRVLLMFSTIAAIAFFVKSGLLIYELWALKHNKKIPEKIKQ